MFETDMKRTLLYAISEQSRVSSFLNTQHMLAENEKNVNGNHETKRIALQNSSNNRMTPKPFCFLITLLIRLAIHAVAFLLIHGVLLLIDCISVN